MMKRVLEIDLDPKSLSKTEIWSLQKAGRSFRIVCPRCGQGMLNIINIANLKNVIWCYECDAVFRDLSRINKNPIYKIDFDILDELISVEAENEISEGVILFENECNQ